MRYRLQISIEEIKDNGMKGSGLMQSHLLSIQRVGARGVHVAAEDDHMEPPLVLHSTILRDHFDLLLEWFRLRHDISDPENQMTEARAREILKEFNLLVWVDGVGDLKERIRLITGSPTVTLHGDFTAAHLRALAWWMENKGEQNG